MKTHHETLLLDTEWLWKLALFADLVNHMNNSNLKLQGENNMTCGLFALIKAFTAKFVLLFQKYKL
jgi:hypothetical protein